VGKALRCAGKLCWRLIETFGAVSRALTDLRWVAAASWRWLARCGWRRERQRWAAEVKLGMCRDMRFAALPRLVVRDRDAVVLRAR